MSFVKISDKEYVNTDYVIAVRFFGDPPRAQLTYVSDTKVSPKEITESAASYFLACVEAQSAMTTEEIAAPSLKTRIAQALRWDFPHGAIIQYLKPLYPKNTTDEINAALVELEAERVVKVKGAYYYHASNLITPNPDPSTEAAETSSNPAENNERS